MFATRRALRYLPLSKRLSALNSQFKFRHLHTTLPHRSRDSSTPSPLSSTPPAIIIKPPIEEYIRQIREQYGDYLPAGLLDESEYKLYERYYGRPTRLLQPGEKVEDFEEYSEEGRVTVHNEDGVEIPQEEVEIEFDETDEQDHLFPPPKTPAEEALYAQVAQRIAHPEGVEKEERDGDHVSHLRPDSPRPLPSHPLTSIGRFATYPGCVHLPPSIKDQTESIIADVAAPHLMDSAKETLGGSLFTFSPIYAGKRSKRCLHIPLNPTHAKMSDMDANVFLTAVMPGLYAQCLSSLSELRRRLGGDWGVKNVLDIGSGGAGILAWRSIVEAEEEGRKDEFSERTGKPGPDGKALPAAWERSGFRAVVVTGSLALRQKASRLLDNTTFIPRMPDIYFENLHYTPGGPTEKNTTQPRKLYDLIIATNRLLPLVENFYRRQAIEQLWSHLNPNGGVLLMIEKGVPMGFEAIASARSTILGDYIKDVGEAFQSPQTTNADGSTNPPIEKGPGAIIAPCTNHEQCPMFAFGPTDGTRRKEYCRFSQRYARPRYMRNLMNKQVKDHEDLEYSYVAFRRGVDHRADTKNKINPAIEDFGTIPVDDDEHYTPIQSPYTMPQLRNYSLTLPRVVFPPIKRDGHVIIDVCTPTGVIERWTVPQSFGKVEYKDARKSRWGDLWALGAKTRVKRNLKIGNDNEKCMSRLIAIRDPFGDGVKAIVKDKTPTFLKGRKKELREKRKEEKLMKKKMARERNEKMAKLNREKRKLKRQRKEGYGVTIKRVAM
ncbi:mitochondrial small ribosomal subunit Rsm22-domain-containing protein [Tuber borchii]|uniref:Mitochondrial small ribosomal subunit Rsm22-domain-containing protein n=1 Tax=Tuber borchii TaxID=42251 RepID=A0A2T7A4R9_TUBBO|nr:mitochondrial small ribosomal subunit Rsm22-domain-containing protein [Tuber borchii]